MRYLSAVLLAGALASSTLGAQPQPAAGTRVGLDSIVALVGSTPILWSDLLEAINQRRAAGMELPNDSAGQLALMREVLNGLVDEEVLVQRARADTGIAIDEADVLNTVEQEMKRQRARFQTDAEFAGALRQSGFGPPEEYRRWLAEQVRRSQLQRRLVEKLRREGRVIPVSVTDAELDEAIKGRPPQRKPATVTFRQLVIGTAASEKARAAARAKAESLLKDIRAGADFELLAKRESMDTTTNKNGGDLGWQRRQTIPGYELLDNLIFGLNPGQVGPVVETPDGFHVVRVDRARPGEVKARQILIRPAYDSTDIARAQARADSALALWKAGQIPLDTLYARYHDPIEERGSLQPFPRAELPEAYGKAFAEAKPNEFVSPFRIEDAARGVPKFVVAQILEVDQGGEYTAAELRDQLRESLAEAKAIRRLIDTLKRETYVSVRI
ncbi:MAG TPA: peptidylprolyl isomerase [Gemmatimonadaceae bacterium]|nr:peptidylprolyl isomerase [Gemmatimonadaceae bacterium]